MNESTRKSSSNESGKHGKLILRKLVRYVGSIFIITIIIIGSISILYYPVDHTNTLVKTPGDFFYLTVLWMITIMIGMLVAKVYISNVMKTHKSFLDAFGQIQEGNYDFRIEYQGDRRLEEFVDRFNQMARELSKTEEIRNEFIDNFSHEFKTPIVSIRGFAKLLQNDELTIEERHEYTQIIVDESCRLTKLMDNIIRLSKIQYQISETEEEEFQLDEQLRRILMGFEQAWVEKEQYVDINLEEVTCKGVPSLMLHVWQNLISNAIRYTDNFGTIRIQCYKKSGYAYVKVADTGIGMTEQTKEKIFEKFYQGDLAHSSQGSGLGLSIVKQIMPLCKGTIEVDSVLHQGSVFTVKFPLDLKLDKVEKKNTPDVD